MTQENLPRPGEPLQGMSRPGGENFDPRSTGPVPSMRAPRAPGGGRIVLPDETLTNEPIPPQAPPWPGGARAEVVETRRIPVIRPAWPPIQMVERASTEDRIGCAVVVGLTAIGLIGLCAGGAYALSLWNETLQQPAPLAATATSTTSSEATAVSGGACVVTSVFNHAPDGSPITFTVKPGHTEVGGLWWKDGSEKGLPWGNREVGIDISGGTQGTTVTTEGNAGGSLWDYSSGCSDSFVQAAQAKYDNARQAVTNFAGDESLQSLENAGAVSAQQDPTASLTDLNPKYAAALHARITARTQARLEEDAKALSKLKGFLSV